jgi:hypothetical protein
MNGIFCLGELQLAARGVDSHGRALAKLSLQHAHRKRIQHPALNNPLQRARRLIALRDEPILRAVGELDTNLPISRLLRPRSWMSMMCRISSRTARGTR